MCNSKSFQDKNYSLKEIYQLFWKRYLNHSDRKLYLEKRHFKAVYDSINCRTAVLGKTVYSCKTCDHKHHIYRSCKNRFCPTCGILETYNWADRILNNLLPIKHHHIVFTLPKPIRNIQKRNHILILNLFFEAATQAIKEWFAFKHNIIPGIVAVLHTAGSDLKHHPHIHMIVSAGGLNAKNLQIQELKSDFLTRQRFLANKFKVIFNQKLITNLKNIKLGPTLSQPIHFKKFLNNINQKQWIISIQKPLKDLNHIVNYVGRYSKRTCISEYNIVNIKNDFITFKFKDYKNTPRGQKPNIALRTLHFTKFLDLLLQHVPHKKFRMVRYAGAYNSCYKKYIPSKNPITPEDIINDNVQWEEFYNIRKLDKINGKPDPLLCPNCKIIMTEYVILFNKNPVRIYDT